MMTEHVVSCPDCSKLMGLGRDSHGVRYLCASPGCSGAHGAHPDGSPLGIPAPKAVRRARSNAHETFDRLWKSGRLTRTQAYRWMEVTLGMRHISELGSQDCRRLEDTCVAEFPDLFPFRSGGL